MWQIVLSAIEVGSKLFGAVDDATTNRRIQSSLREIQRYIKDLGGKLDAIEANTRSILIQLDSLPQTIRLIVREEVELALLNEKYSNLKAIKDDIVYLDNRRRYRINEPGWTELRQAMTYLFMYENRISQLFRLMEGCELTLAATRNRAKPIVMTWMEEKIGLLDELRHDLESAIEGYTQSLLLLLENHAYINSHNLSTSLLNIDSLVFIKQPNRLVRVQTGTRRECNDFGGPCHGGTRCRDIPVYGDVSDTAFHNSRDSHVVNINNLTSLVKTKLFELGALVSVIERMKLYVNRIKDEQLAEENDVVDLIFNSIPKEYISDFESYERASDGDMRLFNDYIAKDAPVEEYELNNTTYEMKHSKYFFETITPTKRIPCDGPV
jgi:hypothetical protein